LLLGSGVCTPHFWCGLQTPKPSQSILTTFLFAYSQTSDDCWICLVFTSRWKPALTEAPATLISKSRTYSIFAFLLLACLYVLVGLLSV